MASYLFTRNEITKLAKKILAMKPDIIAMEGPLGAGKTTLTKAIAKELGIEDVIVSPTFILHREYPGLDHIDARRVEDFSEIERLGLGKMLAEKHLVIIEWADKFRQEIKRLRAEDIKIIWVRLEYAVNENERRITYENIGY